MTDKTLKDRNRFALTLVVIANVVGLYAVAVANSAVDADWVEAAKGFRMLVPAALAMVLMGVLNAQLDATTKARIVFMRWHHPLPGARAFTKHGLEDARVDMDGLRTRLGALPSEPAKQNAVWYQLYRQVADNPAIRHASKEYLFARDYHVLAVGILIVFGIASLWAIEESFTRSLYVGALVLQAFMTGQAARNHGCRLVCTVLALSAPIVPQSPKVTKKKR